MTSFTRRYRFSASHRLHSRHFDQEQNERLYGKCNNPYGHGHDYMLEVTVMGEVDENGLLLPVIKLDALVETEVLELFRYRNLNRDLPHFADLVPTTENIAVVIAQFLEEKWQRYLAGYGARLARIHVQETERNGFTIVLSQQTIGGPHSKGLESVQLHV